MGPPLGNRKEGFVSQEAGGRQTVAVQIGTKNPRIFRRECFPLRKGLCGFVFLLNNNISLNELSTLASSKLSSMVSTDISFKKI